ncbi:hypothetical protein Tco_1293582 [Tanacetum coccineum]
MGELTFFLGLQVKQKEDGIFISQDKYVGEILKKFGFSSIRTASTPMETNKALTKDEDGEDVDVHLYRSMIGSLMYLTSSRPDIMFSVCACSRFQVQPKVSHLNAVKRIFRYLKGRPNLGLWYPKDSPFILEAFSDSDYAGASLDRKSTTGGCQFLGSRLISWQCKKQTVVANSTTEAEYIAASHCCGQVLWIQNQMLDYGYNFMQTKIHVDNESAICVVKNPVYHSKTKHIEIRHHFIRDSYEKRLIEMVKIHTDNNVADLLTKAFDVEGKHDDQLLNTAGLSFLYLKKLCTAGKVTLLFDSMLVQNQEHEGEGLATPPEPQPTPSTSQPNVSEPQTKPLPTETPPPVFHEPQTEAYIEQILPSLTTYQRKRKTQKHRRTNKDTKLPQTRDSDNIIRTQTTAMRNVDIPQGMDTGGSPRRQDTMGVLLLRLGGYTPGSDEEREGCSSCGDPQLKKRVKRLERQRKSSTSQPRRRKYEHVESSDDDLDEEDASKQGRKSDKTNPMLHDSDFDGFDDKTVDAATTGVSTASTPVTTAGVAISTAEPRTPHTTTTVFDEKDVTMDESTGFEIAEMEIA